MTNSLLWERLQVFLTSIHPSTLPTSIPPLPTPPRPPCKKDLRIRALEEALLLSNASLSEERTRRSKWERRALVSNAEQTAQRDELTQKEGDLKQLLHRAKRAEYSLEEEHRARVVAEEQKEVALRHLADSVDEAVVSALEHENALLHARLEEMDLRFGAEKQRLQSENAVVTTEIADMRNAIQAERERFVAELAERTSSFVGLEQELRDARETYVTAAKAFETQQGGNNGRATAGRKSLPSSFERADVDATLVDQLKLEHFKGECRRLERENDALKKERVGLEAGDAVSENKTRASAQEMPHTKGNAVECSTGGNAGVNDSISELSDALKVAKEEHLALHDQVATLKYDRKSCSECMSSSSMSSESEAVPKKGREVEESSMEESREVAQLKEEVAGLTEVVGQKENETLQLRGEMVAIHSKMKRMVTFSMPKGAEALLGEDEDLRKLTVMREAAKKSKAKEDASTSPTHLRKGHMKRRIKLSENKVVRPWLHK